MDKIVKLSVFILSILIPVTLCWSAEEIPVSQDTGQIQVQDNLALSEPLPNKYDNKYVDPTKYTLGPDDVIEIIVMRHPEFSGTYPVNLEGKIQYKFVGDIDVNGLTKKELEQRVKEVIGDFVINPEVNVTIMEYRSKVIYVVGEVRAPGKYYMRSDSIPVREAVVAAGLPTLSAAMRRCRLITPDDTGKAKVKSIDLYSMLYGGNLKHNVEMHSGDVLYVPATVMAKIMSVINPVAAPVTSAATGARSAATLVP
ncbi:MAG: polysaccharide biosynthesis/export family protein [Candidatus Omnitrophota bacterium]